MNNFKRKLWQDFLSSLIAIIIVLIVLFIIFRFTDLFSDSEPDLPKLEEPIITEEEIERDKEETQKQLSDFEKYQSYNQLSIYSDGLVTPLEYIEKTKEVLIKISKTILVSGKIEDVYIYIKAGVGSPLGKLTRHDTLYFYLMDGQYKGGHLDLGQSKLSKFSEVGITEVLYNFKNIPIAIGLENYQENKIDSFNFLDSLNIKEKHYIAGIVSTENYGKIAEMVLAYKCVENSKCNIELLNQ